MAIVQVQQYRKEPEKDNVADILNKVSAALGIARTIHGFSTAGEEAELRRLEKERLEQQLAAGEQAAKMGEMDIAERERVTGLSSAGILPVSEFNKEYRVITPESVGNLEKQSGFPIQTVEVRVEAPDVEGGFETKLAIPKDDLKDITKLISQRVSEKAKLVAQESKAVPKVDKVAAQVDQAFAKDFSKYISEGTEAKTFDTINKLDMLIKDAEENLSEGFEERIMGMMPEGFRKIVDPEDKAIEDRLKAVAQKSLRETLGPQFTEKEGKMIMDRAFDPAQSKSENMRRMRELANSIRQQAVSKKSAMDYFAEHGTLKGFQAPATQPINLMIGELKSGQAQQKPSAPTFQAGILGGGSPPPPSALNDKDFLNQYLSE